MKVGFVGLGNMGSAMVRNLIKAGHTLTVYNRTRSRAEGLQPLGGFYSSSQRRNKPALQPPESAMIDRLLSAALTFCLLVVFLIGFRERNGVPEEAAEPGLTVPRPAPAPCPAGPETLPGAGGSSG